MNYVFTFLFLVSYSILGLSQIGGKTAYSFLQLPPSARITALGAHVISVEDEDVTLAFSNPASLSQSMHNRIAFSHNFHFADIQHSNIGYGRYFEKSMLSTHINLHHVSYGTFDYADILGNKSDQFRAQETALTIGAAKKVGKLLSVGANVKTVFSSLESYNSMGLLMDLGVNYSNLSGDMIASFVVKNVGYELTTYSGTRFGTPIDVQFGISKKLKYLPFRFSLIAHNLHRGNIRYDDPSTTQSTDIFGQPIAEDKLGNFIDNFFRHIVFNGEFLLGKNENLKLRMGYNHLRRQELKLATFRSMAGFSLGFGVKINQFRLDYGLGYHHQVGSTNHITISTSLGKNKKL